MVHQYKLNGYNIVLDTCSGSVHVVDEVAYAIIQLYETNDKKAIVAEILAKYTDKPDVTEEEICLCMEDIQTLIEQGKLFTEDEYESLAIDFKNKSNVLKALCLHVAHH